MARYFIEEGVLLNAHVHREADLMLHVFGLTRGPFRATAPNALKSSYRFMGVLTSSAHLKMHFVWPRRAALPRLVAADVIENFFDTWSDLPRYTLAKAMCEAIQKTIIEWEPAPKTFQLLTHHLRWLSDHPSPEGVFSSFLLILLDHLGIAPVLDRCAHCGKTFEPRKASYMSPEEGGLLCSRCAGDSKRTLPISNAARRSLIDMLGKKRGKKEAIPSDDAISRVQLVCLRAFFEHHIHKHLFALDLRDRLRLNRTACPEPAT